MNVIPKGSAAPAMQDSSQSSRAKAISAFNQSLAAPEPINQQPPTQVVGNQNSISPEEMGAIKAPTYQPPVQETTLPDAAIAASEPKTQEDPALSRQFAQLARQERALRAKQQQQDQALKAREAELAAKQAAIEAKEQEYRTGYISKDTFRQDPLRAMTEAEVSYDEWTQRLLDNATPVDPRIQAQMQKQEQEIQKLQKLIEQRDDQSKQAQQQQYDAAVKQIRLDAQNLIKDDPNYEGIRHAAAVDDVVDLIVRTFNEDGILMSVEDAAEEVENYLVEEGVKFSRLSKVQKQLQANAKPQAPAPQSLAQAQAKPQQPTMKTLTNATGSTRPISARERAMLAFKGQLK